MESHILFVQVSTPWSVIATAAASNWLQQHQQLLPAKVASHQSTSPGELVDSSSLDIFGSRLSTFLKEVIQQWPSGIEEMS